VHRKSPPLKLGMVHLMTGPDSQPWIGTAVAVHVFLNFRLAVPGKYSNPDGQLK